MEAGRHDADDRARDAVHVEDAPEDPGVGAQPRAPHPLVDQDHRWRPATVVRFREGAPDERRRLEDGDEGGRDGGGGHALRLVDASGLRHVHLALAIDADSLDGVGELPVGEVRRHRLPLVRHADRLQVVPGADEPIGIAIGQGTEQHAVHDREDGQKDAPLWRGVVACRAKL